MHDRVVEGRHVTTLDGLYRAIASSGRRVIGEVQDRPTFDHVTLNQPGKWCDVGVPWPGRLITVAVTAGPHSELFGLWAIPGNGV